MEPSAETRSANTILVVDDEPDIVAVTCLQLDAHSYSTIGCNSGTKALEELEKNRVDLVLTDIRMPGMSGIDLLDRIHELYPDIPVILMTAYADLSTTIDAIRKGAYDFIIKPFSKDQLVYSVGKAIRYKAMADMENNYRRILEEFNSEIEALISERTMNLMALTVADKVRNPATVIGGLCRQMQELDNLPEKVAAFLPAIGEEVDKLEKIVAEFQAVLKSRKTLFAYEDLNNVVNEAASLAEKDISRKKLLFSMELSGDQLGVNMEKNLLRIAVFHLIHNAVEASNNGGCISVRTMREDQQAVLVISDNGAGMAPAIIDRIFEPFFSTKAHSFGMGLPLVKQIVTEHLGEINVDSEPGMGTSVRIALPMRWK